MLITKSFESNNHPLRKRYYSPSVPSHPRQYNSRHNYIQSNSSLIKPLEVNQTTFKGFYNIGQKLFSSTVEKLPSHLSNFTFNTLEELSSKQHSVYSNITKEFVEAVKTNKDFRKKVNLSEEWAEKISLDNLPYLPKKAKVIEFAQTIFSPIKALMNLYKPLLKGKIGESIAPSIHASLKKEKEYNALIERYKGFLGLNNSIQMWENSYRKFSGNSNQEIGEEFLIPKDILQKNVLSSRPKVLDPNKGKYSTKSLMLGNRLTSGLIYSFFLSTDAYNTTMKFSSDKKESQKQQKSRFAQENARVGLNLYLQNIIFSTFESSMNKSLGSALLASGATVALSEIVGRQLVSKPIMPSDKKTLDSLEEEMMSKKGFFPALGRMMTRVKKTEKKIPSDTASEKLENSSHIRFKSQNSLIQKQSNPFSAFDSNKKTSKQVSFTGFEKTAQIFDSNSLKKLLSVVENFDSAQHSYFKELIEKSLGSKNPLKEDLYKFLEQNSTVEIGDKYTAQGKVMHSFFAPVYWVKDWIKSGKNIVKGFSPAIKKQEMHDFINKNSLQSEFDLYLQERLNLKVWQNSQLDTLEKQTKIMQEFIQEKTRIAKEIQGVKNVLLWIEKQAKANKLDLDKLTPEQRKELEKSLEKAMILSDSAKHLQYDGNTLSQLNIHLARIITTIFLVTDAYNLTMQYSNDNKKEARGSAKSRAVQEITRISVSAYMLGFVHNLLSKVCNSGLAGAFAVTAVTSVINDSVARMLVGVPLTTQTKEQLDKAANSKL